MGLPSAFLSCSADWTVRLWDHNKETHVAKFHSVDLSDVVHDVAWSPLSSTIFGSVTGDGRIEIWDLSTSLLDPAVCMYSDGTKNEDTFDTNDDPDDKGIKLPAQTSIIFSANAPVVSVGDEAGKVTV